MLALSVTVVDATARDPTLPVAGIGENAPRLFGDAAFLARAVPVVRLIVPWNDIDRNPARLDAWLGGAASAGATPLVAFSNATDCPAACSPPSRSQLGGAFDRLRMRFPWVTEFTAWNEANLAAGTTGSPARAAGYQDELAARCPWCTIVAADVLDTAGMRAWLTAYRAALHTSPRVWGLHNYFDGRTLSDDGLRTVLDEVPGEVWLTETGGIVRSDPLVLGDRAARQALAHVWNLAAEHRDRVRRVYAYSWYAGSPEARFDAGLNDGDGRPRPAMAVFDAMLDGVPHVPIDAPEPPGAAPGTTSPGAPKAGGAPLGDPAPAPGPPARRTVTTTAAAGGLRVARVHWLSGRALRVLLRCEGNRRCRGAVVVRDGSARRRRTLARCAAVLAPGTSGAGTLRLRARPRADVRIALSGRRVSADRC